MTQSGIFIPLFYIVDYAHHLAISPHMAFYTLAAMNAGGVLGRIAPAYVSDAIGHFNILTPSAFLCGLTCLVFWLFSKSLISLMLFAATYGFFSGAFISVITPCVAKISDIREIGTRMGMLYSIISFP
jgi:MFS family permease